MAQFHNASIEAMHTTLTLLIVAPDEIATPFVEEVRQLVGRLHRRFDKLSTESELYHINQEGFESWIHPSDEMHDLLLHCQLLNEKTLGWFDITKNNRLAHCWKVEEKGGIRFRSPQVSLDLGAVAKGYTLDRIIPLLQKHNIENALITFGSSSTLGWGTHPCNDEGWMVSTKNPHNPNEVIWSTTIHNQIVTTSNSHELRSGIWHPHLTDPFSHQPCSTQMVCSTVTESGVVGEAICTAIDVCSDPEQQKEIISNLAPTQIFIYSEPDDE